MRTAAAALVLTLTASAASAAMLTIDEVVSPVYEASGSSEEIARRGQACMAQILRPGVIDAPTIISADPAAGTIVANNAFEYSDGAKFMPLVWRSRSVVTLQAKDGRFRLVHSGVETFYKPTSEWRPGLVATKGADPGAPLRRVSDEIASCVSKGATTADW